MKRRDFLKLIGVAPIAPSILATIPKYHICDMACEKDSYSVSVWVFTGDKWLLVDRMAGLNHHDGLCEVNLSKNAVRGIGAGQLVSIHYDKC